MRHGRISDLIRRTAGALLLLGSVGVSTDTLTLAEDANCATPAQACTPVCSDDVYKRAGERLAQHLQQMGSCSAPCAAGCGAAAPGCANGATGCANGASAGCLSDGCEKNSCLFGGLFGCDDKPLGEPKLLVDCFTDECGNNCLKDKGMTIGGWMQWGYQNGPDGAFTGNGPYITQRGEWNKLNLNQMYLYAAKVADGTKGFDLGYRVDGLFGVDGNEAQSFGKIDKTGTGHHSNFDYLNGWGGPGDSRTHGPYEWAMPQLYGEVAMGNLSVKVGHFYTPIGYEVVTSPDNFFLSRQITFYNSEPFTHTGTLGTYKVNDKLTVIGGWVLGMDTGFYQWQQGSSGISGFTYAFTDKTTLTYAGIYGNLGWRGIGSINSAILSHKWTDKLMSVHQFDVLASNYGTNFAGASGIPGDSTGLINYLFYDINTRLKAGVRQEWFKADGISYNTITYGINYKPTANTVIRPEMRHLFSNVGTLAAPPSAGFSNLYGGSNVFGIDFIYKF